MIEIATYIKQKEKEEGNNDIISFLGAYSGLYFI